MKLDISLVYVSFSLIAILILIYLLYNCNQSHKGQEKFCSCRRMTQAVCPDTYNQTALYESGKLTENSNLAKMQKQAWAQDNEKKWPIVMPEDIFEKQLSGQM